MTYQNHTALLIDAENTPIGKLTTFLEKWRPFDREITLKRAYGNWSNPCLKNWGNLLRTHAIRPVQLTDCAVGKNAADIALTADAVELLLTGQYDTFIIMSSDSDYTPLVMKLREAGVRVLGIGKDDAPEAYRNACTNYVCLHNIYSEDPDSLQALLEKCAFCDDEDVPTERCDLIGDDDLDLSFLFDEDDLLDEENFNEESDLAKETSHLVDDLFGEAAPDSSTQETFISKIPEDAEWLSDEEFAELEQALSSLAPEAPDEKEDEAPIVWDSLDDLLNELAPPSETAEISDTESAWDTLSESEDNDTDSDWSPFSGIGENDKIVWETLSTLDENGDIIWDTLDDDFGFSQPPAKSSPEERSMHKLLHVAYDYCKDENGYALLSSIGNFIKEIRPEFDYRDYGFKQLHELLLAYPDKYQLVTCLVKPDVKVLAFCCCA